MSEDSQSECLPNEDLDAAPSQRDSADELLVVSDIAPLQPQVYSRFSILWMAFVVEGGLAAIGIGLAFWLDVPIQETFRWNIKEIAIGLAAAVPMLLFLSMTIQSKHPSFVKIRELLNDALMPRLMPCGHFELLFIAALAGICEELLFRTFLQRYLEQLTHPVAGLLLASLVFGLLHSVSFMYAILTITAGVYLGYVWWITELNSYAVMITHGLYDYVAFVLFLKAYKREHNLSN